MYRAVFGRARGRIGGLHGRCMWLLVCTFSLGVHFIDFSFLFLPRSMLTEYHCSGAKKIVARRVFEKGLALFWARRRVRAVPSFLVFINDDNGPSFFSYVVNRILTQNPFFFRCPTTVSTRHHDLPARHCPSIYTSTVTSMLPKRPSCGYGLLSLSLQLYTPS